MSVEIEKRISERLAEAGERKFMKERDAIRRAIAALVEKPEDAKLLDAAIAAAVAFGYAPSDVAKMRGAVICVADLDPAGRPERMSQINERMETHCRNVNRLESELNRERISRDTCIRQKEREIDCERQEHEVKATWPFMFIDHWRPPVPKSAAVAQPVFSPSCGGGIDPDHRATFRMIR